MSGIAGFARWGGGVDTVYLSPMLQAMQHRSAIPPALWTDGTAAIACTGLRQGACSAAACSRAAAVWTGHLHRRADLGRALGRDHTNESDAGLVLAAYEAWGDACATRIEGEYACAIWDRRERRMLIIRDRTGSRPLVFSIIRDGILFATDTQAIRAHPAHTTRINEVRIADFLMDDMSDPRATFFEGIERVPAGCCTSLTDRHARTVTYWEPPRGIRADSNSSTASVQRDVEIFRALFTEAVAERMPADATIGILLSGGLDSSSIACAAANARAAADRTAPIAISGVFDTLPGADERDYITQVVAATGIQSRYVGLDCIAPLAFTDDIIRCHDEPPWMPNLFMYWHGMLPVSRDAGISVLLDGSDGDTVVSDGGNLIHDLLWAGRFQSLWHEARLLGEGSLRRTFDVIARFGITPRIPAMIRRARRRIRSADTGPRRLIEPALYQRARIGERARAAEAFYSAARNDADAHWFSVTAGVNTYVLELLERSAAWHGLELQHPFYDHRLIEHCVGIAADRKLRNGEPRWILREAMADCLPVAVRQRITKADLSPSFRTGMFQLERSRIRSTVARQAERLAPYVDAHALDTALPRYDRGSDPFDALAVWKLHLLGAWLEHVERGASDTGRV